MEAAVAGKGDRYRPVNHSKWEAGYARAFADTNPQETPLNIRKTISNPNVKFAGTTNYGRTAAGRWILVTGNVGSLEPFGDPAIIFDGTGAQALSRARRYAKSRGVRIRAIPLSYATFDNSRRRVTQETV